MSTFWGTAENKCLLLRVQFRLGAYCTPNTEAVVLIEATGTWVHAETTQVQAVRIVAIDRSRRPIVATATSTARRRRIEATGVEEVVRIGS